MICSPSWVTAFGTLLVIRAERFPSLPEVEICRSDEQEDRRRKKRMKILNLKPMPLFLALGRSLL